VSAGAPALDVAFTPADVRATTVAVMLDVLRASSTLAMALASGYARVLCCDGVERAEALRGPGRVLAGERECRPIPGFDHGNSPAALPPGRGRELVLTTSNGCPAILAAAAVADEVLVGSLLNLDAVVGAIARDVDVTVVCAGTDGRFALEDAYVAGRLTACLEGEPSDAVRAARRIAAAYPDAYEPLRESADAAVLRATGQEDDIAFCARDSVLDVVGEVTALAPGVATVSPRTATRSATPGVTHKQSSMPAG
jgi:2-phosphosulfolactate phosphatase